MQKEFKLDFSKLTHSFNCRAEEAEAFLKENPSAILGPPAYSFLTYGSWPEPNKYCFFPITKEGFFGVYTPKEDIISI